MTTYQFTEEHIRKLLSEVIGMYEEEIKRKSGFAGKWPECQAKEHDVKSASKSQAIQEMVEGLDAEQELIANGQLERVKAGQNIIEEIAQGETVQDVSDLELQDIEREVTEELEMLISDAPSGDCPMLNDTQPPTSVIRLMAEAAAKVLMAFERGYRMG